MERKRIIQEGGNVAAVAFSIQENVLIKKELPKAGVVSSNPQRAQRMIDKCLHNVKEHTNSWGVVVYTGDYQGHALFVGSVPMGAGGSGFAFLEMYAAGAEYIVRYGSNDRYVTQDNLNDIIIIDKADNLYGLMRDSGTSSAEWGTSLSASPVLIEAFTKTAVRLGYPVKRMVCHHVEDYHAYNYPELMGNQDGEVKKIIQNLDTGREKQSAWDMETAALFWRAKQFNRHAVTVLQSLIKHKGKQVPYAGEHGKISINMEDVFHTLIFQTMSEFLKSEKT